MNWSKYKMFLSLLWRRRFSPLALLLALGLEGLLLAVLTFAQAPMPAFPEAQGAGAAAVGGRGGQAIEVTNLNDSGVGSLRECIEASGPRVCLFRVAGIINVQGDLRIGNPYLTIAGQTAPGGGIKLTGTGAIMWVNTHDVVIRYLSYDGNSAQNGPDDGSVSFDAGSGNVYNVVFDHVSGFHVTNKQLIVLANDGGAVHNVTFQWSMTYKPDAQHPVGPMVDATTWPATGVTDIDYHHNFFGDTSHRLPLFNGASGRWVSNLIYNWNQFATLVQGGAKFDAIDNNYVSGPGLGHGQQGCNNHEIEGDLAQSTDDVSHSMPGPPLFWLSGNQGPNGTDWAMTAEVRSEGGCEVANPVENSWRRSGPLPAETFPITADAAATLDTVLLATVGNSQGLNCDGTWNPRRQTEDAAMIAEYKAKSQGSLWTAPSGYQTAPVAGGSPCAEDPANHLPTAYEAKAAIAAGTSPNAIAANGYTVFENYLNGASSGTVTPPPPPPPPPATSITVTPQFFGMTWNTHANVPSVPFGALRLWDTGTSWQEVNTAAGVYNWTGLDGWLAVAATQNAKVLYTFGRVPVWISSNPTQACGYGLGCAAPPSDLASGDATWKAYVTALVKHSVASTTAHIEAYELWNEPNIAGTWTGTPAQLEQMAQDAYTIIRALDPNAIIVGPSPTTSDASTVPFLPAYYAAGGATLQDVVGVHGYLSTTATLPGPITTGISKLQALMTANGIGGKPIWVTEANWGKTLNPTLTPAQKAAYLAEEYLLLYSTGAVQRFYWYAWDNGSGYGQLWSASGGVSPAGVAYGLLDKWMVGATSSGTPCATDGNGSTACSLKLANGNAAQILWNPNTSLSYGLAADFTQLQTLSSSTSSAVTGNSVPIGALPVMVSAVQVTTPPPPPGTLAFGASVVTITSTNGRATADGTLIKVEPTGTAGTVLAGPTTVSGNAVTWWQVKFADGTTGWVGADELNVTANTPPPPPTQPSAPSGGTSSVKLTVTATVSWAASASVGVTSYNVYRAATTAGPFTKVGNSVFPTFTDTTVAAATSYLYVITAVAPVDSTPESAQSAPIAVAVP